MRMDEEGMETVGLKWMGKPLQVEFIFKDFVYFFI